MRDAAALAGAAVVAGCAAIVILGENGCAADRHEARAVEALQDPLARGALDRRHLHGRQELAVGQLRPALRSARDPDELLHMRIPGRNVLVADRPVITVTVLGIRLEIQVAPAIDLSAPGNGPAADLAPAKPTERRAISMGVRILDIANEEYVSDLIAGVTVGPDRALVVGQPAMVPIAEQHLVGLHVLHIVLG